MMQPLRGSDVRQLNERIVLNLFYNYDRVSQSDIVAQTGLKASTVLRIFSNLEKDGEIIMLDPAKDSPKREKVGRRPVYYRLNPQAHHAIGLTFAKDIIELVIVDFALNVVYTDCEEFSLPGSPDQMAEKIAAFVRKAIERAKIDPATMIGVGVGCPGDVEPERGVLLRMAAGPEIRDYPLAERLSELLGLRVFLQGSNQLAAQYYQRYEDGEIFDRCLYISIGSELTASYYSKTPHGQAGGIPSLAIGWILTQKPDRLFSMRDSHTLNDICSEKSILSFANAVAGISTMGELDEALRSNMPSMLKLTQDIGSALSYWISNLAMLLQPKTIILASRSKHFSRALTEELNRILEGEYYWPFAEEPKIFGKEHSYRKISRSAVDLVFDHEFLTELGWKRPQLLNQPKSIANWQEHISE